MRHLTPLLLLTACAAPEKEVAPTAVLDPSVERMPALVFETQAWETAGSVLSTDMRLEQPFAGDSMELSFEYAGPGEVELPAPMTLGVSELGMGVPVRFTAVAGDSGEGRIDVVYASQTEGEVVVGSLPVVHSLDLVRDIQFHAADSMMDASLNEAAFVVVVDLAPPAGPHAQALAEERSVELHATLEAQAGFGPGVQVQRHVDPASLSGLPIVRSMDRVQEIFLITVEQRSTAPMRRPFVKIEATLGGDREVEYLPLQF